MKLLNRSMNFKPKGANRGAPTCCRGRWKLSLRLAILLRRRAERNSTTQFLLEGIVLCEIGGVIGVVLGIIGGNLAVFYMKLAAQIPLNWAAFGLLNYSMVVIVFGGCPAGKAASLDPIESLRYE